MGYYLLRIPYQKIYNLIRAKQCYLLSGFDAFFLLFRKLRVAVPFCGQKCYLYQSAVHHFFPVFFDANSRSLDKAPVMPSTLIQDNILCVNFTAHQHIDFCWNQNLKCIEMDVYCTLNTTSNQSLFRVLYDPIMEFQIAAMVLVFARSGYLHYYYHLFAILITDNVSFICVLSSAIHNTRVLQFTSLVF